VYSKQAIKKNPEIHFYKLPNRKSQPLRRQNWIQAIRHVASAGKNDKLWDLDNQYVCSKQYFFGGSTAYKNVFLGYLACLYTLSHSSF